MTLKDVRVDIRLHNTTNTAQAMVDVTENSHQTRIVGSGGGEKLAPGYSFTSPLPTWRNWDHSSVGMHCYSGTGLNLPTYLSYTMGAGLNSQFPIYWIAIKASLSWISINIYFIGLQTWSAMPSHPCMYAANLIIETVCIIQSVKSQNDSRLRGFSP